LCYFQILRFLHAFSYFYNKKNMKEESDFLITYGSLRTPRLCVRIFLMFFKVFL